VGFNCGQDGECESDKSQKALAPLQDYLDELLIPEEPTEVQDTWHDCIEFKSQQISDWILVYWIILVWFNFLSLQCVLDFLVFCGLFCLYTGVFDSQVPAQFCGDFRPKLELKACPLSKICLLLQPKPWR
jgi:hypothetical protein